jgi:hypothetical protein
VPTVSTGTRPARIRSQIMQWLQVTLPVETVLLGSAVGFYFANRR